jgi:hypothetical protein
VTRNVFLRRVFDVVNDASWGEEPLWMQGAGRPVCLCACLCACLCLCLLPGSHSMPDINSLIVEARPAFPVSLHRAHKGVSRLVCVSADSSVPVAVSVDSSRSPSFTFLARGIRRVSCTLLQIWGPSGFCFALWVRLMSFARSIKIDRNELKC